MRRHLFASIKDHFSSQKWLLVFLAFFFTLPSFQTHSQSFDNYAIFTLNDTFSALSKYKAKMLYRGKIRSLQGQRIELSDWPSEHPVRNEFYQQLLGKDNAQMNAYWASLSFSGKARPPKEMKQDNMNALINWLEAKQNRIGYAPLQALPANANILFIIKVEKSS